MTTSASAFIKALGIVKGVRLARALNVTPQYVSKMKRQAMNDLEWRLKAEWAAVIEREALGKVTKADLRPDLFSTEGGVAEPDHDLVEQAEGAGQ